MVDEKQTPVDSDLSKHANDHAVGEAQAYIDPKKESRMLLKFDVRHLPPARNRPHADRGNL